MNNYANKQLLLEKADLIATNYEKIQHISPFKFILKLSRIIYQVEKNTSSAISVEISKNIRNRHFYAMPHYTLHWSIFQNSEKLWIKLLYNYLKLLINNYNKIDSRIILFVKEMSLRGLTYFLIN